MANNKVRYRIYTDGSIDIKSRFGASGFIVLRKDGDEEVRVNADVTTAEDTTISRMEITAAIDGVRHALNDSQSRSGKVIIDVYSDSKMLVDAYNDYIPKWEKKSIATRGEWMSSNGSPVANQDLYKSLMQMVRESKADVRLIHVKAHADSVFNNEVDQMVNRAVVGA